MKPQFARTVNDESRKKRAYSLLLLHTNRMRSYSGESYSEEESPPSGRGMGVSPTRRPRSPSPYRGRRSASPRSRPQSRSQSRSPRSPPEKHADVTNVANLAPLPDIGVKSVDISDYPELLNEPYCYAFEDNGERPEFTVGRPRFSLEIDEDTIFIRVGSLVIGVYDHYMPSYLALPEKSGTNFSVLNVFDTYGLDVTYAFLNYIYTKKFYSNHQMWLVAYLAGSYFYITGTHLPGSMEEEGSSAYYFITSLLLQLVVREQKKFKLEYELKESGVLPPEIVGRIVGSERISKEVGREVRSTRCTSIPTIEEVSGQSAHDGVRWVSEEAYLYIITNPEEGVYLDYQFRRVSEDQYELTVESIGSDELEYPEGELVSESLYSYYATFVKRGCNGKTGVDLVLSDLKKRLSVLTEDNVGEIGTWLLQLLADLNSLDYEGVYTRGELVALFAQLIEEAKHRDWTTF